MLTVAQAAIYLNISEWEVYNLVSSGRLAFYRIGPRLTRFRTEDLEAFVKSCRCNGTKQRKGGASFSSASSPLPPPCPQLTRKRRPPVQPQGSDSGAEKAGDHGGSLTSGLSSALSGCPPLAVVTALRTIAPTIAPRLAATILPSSPCTSGA